MDNVFVYVGVYDSKADAEADYDILKELHSAKAVGTYDVAVISKDADGKVQLTKHEKPTQHGAWSGLVVGGLIGLFFPPAWIVGGAAIGAAAGGLAGHLFRGMSRGDLKELGEALARELKRTRKVIEKEIRTDRKALDDELKKSIDEAARQ